MPMLGMPQRKLMLVVCFLFFSASSLLTFFYSSSFIASLLLLVVNSPPHGPALAVRHRRSEAGAFHHDTGPEFGDIG